MGWLAPRRIDLSMSSTEAVPDSTRPMASLIMGISSLLTTKPGPQPPQRDPCQYPEPACTRSQRSPEACSRMTSMSFILGTGLKKCIPMRAMLQPWPISVMDREEVLEAKPSPACTAHPAAEQLLLGTHLLRDALDHQIGVRSGGFLFHQTLAIRASLVPWDILPLGYPLLQRCVQLLFMPLGGGDAAGVHQGQCGRWRRRPEQCRGP